MSQDHVALLQAKYNEYLTKPRGEFFQNRRKSVEARLCRWFGQTEDGRKHYSLAKGQGPFPWDGATDLRLPLIDRIIREEAAVLVNSLNPVYLRALPVRAEHTQLAGRLTAFARWLLFSDQVNFWREASYLAELLLEDGVAVAMVYWDRRSRRSHRSVDLETIEEGLTSLQGLIEGDLPIEIIQTMGLAEWFVQVIRDPGQEETAIRLLKTLHPDSDATQAEWRKVVRDLAETNRAEIPTPVVVKDQPVFRALAYAQDVLLPPGCEDIETADVIFLRERYTESQLRIAARVRGYSDEWVERVVETNSGRLYLTPLNNRDFQTSTVLDDEHSPTIEIVTAIQRIERRGQPLTRITVMAADGVSDMSGLDEEYDDPDSVPSFVLWTYESRTRLPENCRGLPAMLWSLQDQIKRMRDLQCDRADMAILPPWYHPPGQRPVSFGPGVAVETAQPDLFGFFRGPQYDPASDRLVQELMEEFFSIAGRVRADGANATEALAYRQATITRWLVGWKRVVEIMVRMARKYAPDNVVGRVIGTNQGEPLSVSREEMMVDFDVSFTWDPSQHDLEYKRMRLEMLRALMEYDVLGRVDQSEMTQIAAEIIDPSLAERLLRPAQAASLQELDDEKAVLARMMVGIGEDVREGQNYALRLNALQQLLQLPTVQKQLASNPDAAALVQNRIRQLQHQVQQRENAIIGRLGAASMETA